MSHVADCPTFAIQIEAGIATTLAEGNCRPYSARRCAIELTDFGSHSAPHVQLVDRLAQRRRVNRMHIPMDEPASVELAQDSEDTARMMHVLHVRRGR